MRDSQFAKFSLGQIVWHREMRYRGVVVDVDPAFLGNGETASQSVGENEPLDRPWYHVLGDRKEHVTYVSENCLTADHSGQPVEHPSLQLFFKRQDGNHYVPRRITN